MIATLALTLICVPTPAVLYSLAAPAVAVQGVELSEAVKMFDDLLKSKEPDSAARAIAAMDDFLVRFRGIENEIAAIDDSVDIGEGDVKHLLFERKGKVKDLSTIATTVYNCFVHKARKTVNEDNLNMWKAAAYTLGQMGENGGRYLLKAFDLKKFSKEPELRGLFVEQVGYTHAYQAFGSELIDLLDHSEYLFIAKASDALAQFGEAPGKVRKEAIERISKLLAQNYESTISNKTDEEAQKKYRMTGRAMQNALEALAGVSLDGPLEWTTWWNKNKNDAELWGEK
jgi:hypothetical protein